MNDPPPGCSAGPVSDKDCNYSFILFNPLSSDRFSHAYGYNKYGTAYCEF